MHPGETVTAARITNSLQYLRKKFQKQQRVLAPHPRIGDVERERIVSAIVCLCPLSANADKDDLAKGVDAHADQAWEMAKKIWDFAEPGYLLPFPAPPAELGLATQVRTTLIATSLQSLRARGLLDRYTKLLQGRHKETILTAVAGSWLSSDDIGSNRISMTNWRSIWRCARRTRSRRG